MNNSVARIPTSIPVEPVHFEPIHLAPMHFKPIVVQPAPLAPKLIRAGISRMMPPSNPRSGSAQSKTPVANAPQRAIPSMIRIIIADDHAIVRAGLKQFLAAEKDMVVTGEAADGMETLACVRKAECDVVLLDIRLGESSGIDLCRQIKAASPATRVLILTSYVDDQLILSALEAGADGYLLKESDTKRLVNAINEVHRGEAVFDPEVTRQMASHNDETSDNPAQLIAGLSLQERRLLAEVAKGKTDKEAAAELGLTAKTARNYLDRIFTKLGVHTRTEAATAYIRAGKRVWEAP